MLKHISTEELREEIKRRNNSVIEPPKQIKCINIEPLKEICQSYIDALNQDGYIDEKYKQYIFEAAIEYFYGYKVWEWVRDKSV